MEPDAQREMDSTAEWPEEGGRDVSRDLERLLLYLDDPSCGLTWGRRLEALYEGLGRAWQLLGLGGKTGRPGPSECRGDVPMTVLEAEYLADGATLEGRVFDLNGGSMTGGYRDRCPLFDDDKGCLVFPRRPIVCRLVRVVAPTTDCSVWNGLCQAASEWLADVQLNVAGRHFGRDVRDWFPAGRMASRKR